MIQGSNVCRRRWLLVAPVLCCGLFLLTCDNASVTRFYDRGVVVTAAPIATDIGVQVFASRGNAFDAAVAVGFALAVVHPQAGNIGGGGFAVIREAKTGMIRTLDFRETAPTAATPDMFLDSSGAVIENASVVGARAAGVPGTVAGLHALWKEYGSLPWEELVGMAASLADSGFVVDEPLGREFQQYRSELSQFEETGRIFAPGGRTPAAGEKFVQTDLGSTLQLIASEGPPGFYGGQVADSIVATMQKHGGLITHDDLLAYRAEWREPIHFRFDSLDIYSMAPPSSGGLIIAQILKLLEPYRFTAWSPNAPEYIHLFAEMSRLAFADRAEYLGDPEFFDVPRGLLDSGYLDRRRNLVDSLHASNSADIRPGLEGRSESDQTTHFSVCDAAGNMVAITYTINTSYGSKLVVGGAGFLLNNEMDDFAIKPGVPNTYGLIGGEANKIEPGKRMLSSMAPTLVLLNKEPFLIVGSPGGSKIITAVAQTLFNFSRFNQTLSQAVTQPRFHHQWLPDVLYLEAVGFDINTKQALIRYGHNVEEREPYGDVQAIYINTAGLMTGASDPRGRGTVGGL